MRQMISRARALSALRQRSSVIVRRWESESTGSRSASKGAEQEGAAQSARAAKDAAKDDAAADIGAKIKETGRRFYRDATAKVQESGSRVKDRVEQATASSTRGKGVRGFFRMVVDELKNDGTASKKRPVSRKVNEEARGMVLVDKGESKWDRLKKTNPVIERLDSGMRRVGEGLEDLSDRFFGENENSLTMREIKLRDPYFDVEVFTKDLQEDLIPKVIGAYLRGDLASIKPILSEGTYSTLDALVRDRISQNVHIDPRILDIRHVEMQTARLIDGDPHLVYTFRVQQVNCMRDASGKVIEGGPDEIQSVYYQWALRQSEEFETDVPWLIVHMGIQGAHKTL